MIESKAEHEALEAMLRSDGWAVIERVYKEKAKSYLTDAIRETDPMRSKMNLNGYQISKKYGELPYALLDESNFKEEF